MANLRQRWASVMARRSLHLIAGNPRVCPTHGFPWESLDGRTHQHCDLRHTRWAAAEPANPRHWLVLDRGSQRRMQAPHAKGNLHASVLASGQHRWPVTPGLRDCVGRSPARRGHSPLPHPQRFRRSSLRTFAFPYKVCYTAYPDYPVPQQSHVRRLKSRSFLGVFRQRTGLALDPVAQGPGRDRPQRSTGHFFR